MKFNTRSRGSQMPELNLVPMLDVLMTVLTFFILMSMTLSTQEGVDIQLPSANDTPAPVDAPKPLIVQLKPPEQLLIDQQPVTEAQVQARVRAYLAQTPKGFAVLQADNRLPYETVIQVLGELKQIGGDRISLAIEE